MDRLNDDRLRHRVGQGDHPVRLPPAEVRHHVDQPRTRRTVDIYLADVGANGLYGYCTTDDPNALDPNIFDVSVFCVVDNDMSPAQFQGNGFRCSCAPGDAGA